MLIQLQRVDSWNSNAGGLYINVEHISAIYVIERVGDGKRQCVIELLNGNSFTPVQSVSEVLDAIAEARENKE